MAIDADASCQAAVDPSAFDNGSTDVDADTLTFSVNQSGPYAVGTTDLTLTVSDGTDSATCSAQVIVTDAIVSKASINFDTFQKRTNLNCY